MINEVQTFNSHDASSVGTSSHLNASAVKGNGRVSFLGKEAYSPTTKKTAAIAPSIMAFFKALEALPEKLQLEFHSKLRKIIDKIEASHTKNLRQQAKISTIVAAFRSLATQAKNATQIKNSAISQDLLKSAFRNFQSKVRESLKNNTSSL